MSGITAQVGSRRALVSRPASALARSTRRGGNVRAFRAGGRRVQSGGGRHRRHACHACICTCATHACNGLCLEIHSFKSKNGLDVKRLLWNGFHGSVTSVRLAAGLNSTSLGALVTPRSGTLPRGVATARPAPEPIPAWE